MDFAPYQASFFSDRPRKLMQTEREENIHGFRSDVNQLNYIWSSL